MKKVICMLFAVALCGSMFASVADWKINLSDTNYTSYVGGTVYSYLLSTSTSLSSTDIVNKWVANNSYTDETGVYAGNKQSTGWNDSASNTITGGINGIEFGRGELANYLLVIIAKENGDYLWASYGDGNDVYPKIRGDTEAVDKMTMFDSTSTWTEHKVPEPTALALLALGVAGLALRRKCA